MKKTIVYALVLVVILAVVLLVVFLGDKNLDMQSEQVSSLYSYLGEVDIYHCGGLNQYSGDEVTYDTISNENKLCMAYYELNQDEIEVDSSIVTTTNESDVDICEIGEGIRLAADEDMNNCSYESFSQTELAIAYEKIYGNSLPDDEEFYISNTKACYLEGDTYYCGNAETIVYSLTPEATIYRLMNQAVEKLNGDIVITDYYLKVSGNKCYSSNNANNEIAACSSSLAENDNLEIDAEFVQEYGTLYKHTFKKDDQGNYYWYASDLN